MNATKKDKLVILSAFIGLLLVSICAVTMAAKSFEYNPIPVIRNNPARVANVPFTPNQYRATIGTYTVSITTAVSLLNLNSAGSVYFDISQDGVTWSTINSAGISRTLAVSLSVGLNETTQFNVQGVVPQNWQCRLRTVVSGGATATYTSGQEVMY